MTYSEIMKKTDEFNALEPTEIIMHYRYWEDDPGKRMLIMPAASAGDKFMTNKGIYARYVYSKDHTDEEVIKALIADKFKFYQEFCNMYLECLIDTDGGLNDTDGND